MELRVAQKLQSGFSPTCSDVRCLVDVWIHLVLARLSFALGQAVDCAAYAERNQQACQGVPGHFEQRL